MHNLPCVSSSDFKKGIVLGERTYEHYSNDDRQEVKQNPWGLADSIFNLTDPHFTEEQRAGYLVGIFSQVFQEKA